MNLVVYENIIMNTGNLLDLISCIKCIKNKGNEAIIVAFIVRKKTVFLVNHPVIWA